MEQKIVDLSLERLQELATHLELVVDGDGKLKVLRHVRRKLEERIDSAEDKLSVVTDILEFIGTPNTEAAQVDEYAQAKDELQRMQDEFKKTLELQQKQIDEATAKLSSITQSKNVAEQETVSNTSNNMSNTDSILRREFKIVGSIGGEKDKLSYVGLMRQIESGTAKGFVFLSMFSCFSCSTVRRLRECGEGKEKYVPKTAQDTTQRLAALRLLMRNVTLTGGIKAYIIPSSDPHQDQNNILHDFEAKAEQTEYVAAHHKRREFITGFTGSRGTAIVTQHKAAMWTDGRYFVQANMELDCNWTLMKEGIITTPGYGQWLKMV
ncbi:Xaa-Pro aminopeptidase 1 [Exaiptasia diaphana]|nr:Xaa-Pro aminopeptidase 1 [Exaiptasia diaphana]